MLNLNLKTSEKNDFAMPFYFFKKKVYPLLHLLILKASRFMLQKLITLKESKIRQNHQQDGGKKSYIATHSYQVC